jgi:rubredoxin
MCRGTQDKAQRGFQLFSNFNAKELKNSTMPKSELMSDPEEIRQCQTTNCGYMYDPERGDRKGKIPKGARFKDLPDSWRCPICGGTKKCFRPLTGAGSTKEVQCELPTAN